MRRTVDETAKKSDKESNTPLFGALAVLLAAIVAGTVAIWNQKLQASHSRALKAIELIIESRSPNQARIRKSNLRAFLDDKSREQMEDIEKSFAGDEWTNLRVELAKSMADKATSADEVLAVWKTVFPTHELLQKIGHRGQ